MSIEVKQLVVKGVIQRLTEGNVPVRPQETGWEGGPQIDVGALKEELLESCRRMVEDALRHRRER